MPSVACPYTAMSDWDPSVDKQGLPARQGGGDAPRQYISPPVYRGADTPRPSFTPSGNTPPPMARRAPSGAGVRMTPPPPPPQGHVRTRRRIGTPAIALLCILGLLISVSIGVGASYSLFGSQLAALFGSGVRPWEDDGISGMNPIIPDSPPVGGETDGGVNAPSIGIVSIPRAQPEKIIDDSGREVLAIPAIAEQAKPSVVGIIVRSTQNVLASSLGSGVVFSEDGYIVTNAHVVSGGDNIRVILDDQTEYDGRVVGLDEKADIAVIKIEAQGLTPAEFGDSDMLRVGDLAVAIGSPSSLELQGTTTAGIISAVNRQIAVDESGRTLELLQTDAAINPGNSGGPLLNQYGQVIGINTVRLDANIYEGLCFAIPSNVVGPLIDELLANGYVRGYPSIGIRGAEVTSDLAAMNRIPLGVIISYVEPGSDAAAKGLQPYDIITAVNGQSVRTVAEINQIKNAFSVGDELTLTIYRSAKSFDVQIRLVDEADLGE